MQTGSATNDWASVGGGCLISGNDLMSFQDGDDQRAR